MPSTYLFISATLLLSLNFVRPFGLAISDWLYLGALGFAIIETILIKHQHASCWWRNRFLWAVLSILIGAIISTMNSRNWGLALVEIFQQVFVITLFVSLTWIMVCRGMITPITLAFILSGVFTASVVLVDYWSGSRYGPALSGTPNLELWGRYAGTLGHPNKLGYFLVLTTLLSIGQSFNLKPARTIWLTRLLWGVLIAIQVLGIYLSGSVTGYLGLLLGAIVLTLFSKSIFVSAVKTMGVVVGVCALVIIFNIVFSTFIMGSTLNLENTSIVQGFNRVRTITADARTVIYYQAWSRIIRNPWFGVGYDQISTSGLRSAPDKFVLDIHNALLQIWYTGGLFAFLGWLVIYVSIGWMALGLLRRRKYHALSPLIVAVAATSLAILLMDQFQDAIYQREKWLVIGLLAGFSWEKIGLNTPPDRSNG